MLKKCKLFLNSKRFASGILVDLSIAFDFLRPDLLICKLNAHGFGNNILKLLYSYLTGRKERVKIKDTCIEWEIVSHGVYFKAQY